MIKDRFYAEVCGFTDPSLIENCIRATTEKFSKKGEILIHAGEPEQNVYFLISGCCRGVILDQDGNEFTDCFSFRCGSVVRASIQLSPEVPAPFNVESLEDSLYYCIPVPKVLEFQDVYPEVNVLWHRLLCEQFDNHRKSEQAMYLYDAEGRYHWFLQEYPGLIDRVSKKHIASFLHMNPATLSRLRRNTKEDETDDSPSRLT